MVSSAVQPLSHLDVWNACFLEFVANRLIAELLVKWFNVGLCVEFEFGCAVVPSGVFDGPHQRCADAIAPIGLADRNSLNLADRGLGEPEPSSPDGILVVTGKKLDRIRVVSIEFLVLGDALFLDEHCCSDGCCRIFERIPGADTDFQVAHVRDFERIPCMCCHLESPKPSTQMRVKRARMTYDYARDHEHELSAEYLYASDAEVLGIYDADDSLQVDVAVICPECSETLRLETTVDKVTSSGTELPLDEDYYD